MKRASNAPLDVPCDFFVAIKEWKYSESDAVYRAHSTPCKNRAKYDAPTVYGSWAYMCESHFATEKSENAESLGYIIV